MCLKLQTSQSGLTCAAAHIYSIDMSVVKHKSYSVSEYVIILIPTLERDDATRPRHHVGHAARYIVVHTRTVVCSLVMRDPKTRW